MDFFFFFCGGGMGNKFTAFVLLMIKVHLGKTMWLLLQIAYYYYDFFNCRSFIKRSLSDGNIDSPVVGTDIGHNEPLSEKGQGRNTGLSESTPEISTCESDISYCRSDHLHFLYSLPRELALINLGFNS